ncbi:MAG TPA: GTPase ObgE [Candidatus Dormibacteraeota bacterium]|nr:GTPase ObgE [Candidatus Dormibacteraeota bacterium]
MRTGRVAQDQGSFVDAVRIQVRAGHGGRGAVSFRREPYVPRGGPDGGDGGRGGSVVLYATTEATSLVAYISRQVLRAESGRSGAGKRRSGGAGADLRLPVPVGTVVVDEETGAIVADLEEPGAEAVVARGGAGGRGNVHFRSSVQQAPQLAEPGLPGQDRWLRLELKLIADVGLVGPPNAGKSSLLRAVSAATPRVADYPFTTLDPQLGVAELADGRRLVLADIPGLIEGAARGAGLGHRFLRHVERTRVLLYLVDGADPDPWATLDTVRREVAEYAGELAGRPALTAVNKLDLPVVRELRERAGQPDVRWVSALTGEGVPELLEALGEAVAAAPPPPVAGVAPEPERLRQRQRRTSAEAPLVERHSWGYLVAGPAVERLVARTRFDSEAATQRFQVALDRLGVSSALEEAGAEPGDTVRIGEIEFEYQP